MSRSSTRLKHKHAQQQHFLLEQRRCHSPWRQIEISNLQFHFLFSILVRFVPAPVFSWLSALP